MSNVKPCRITMSFLARITTPFLASSTKCVILQMPPRPASRNGCFLKSDRGRTRPPHHTPRDLSKPRTYPSRAHHNEQADPHRLINQRWAAAEGLRPPLIWGQRSWPHNRCGSACSLWWARLGYDPCDWWRCDWWCRCKMLRIMSMNTCFQQKQVQKPLLDQLSHSCLPISSR